MRSLSIDIETFSSLDIKKYRAKADVVFSDGRARGLLQYPGRQRKILPADMATTDHKRALLSCNFQVVTFVTFVTFSCNFCNFELIKVTYKVTAAKLDKSRYI